MRIFQIGQIAVLATLGLLMVDPLEAERVRVERVVDGTTLLVREVFESEKQYEEFTRSLEKRDGKVGVIGLAGIKLEPFDHNLYEPELISEIGLKAKRYLEVRLADEEWNFEIDSFTDTEEGKVPYGYLISDSGSILNVELVKEGYSPYFYRDEWALRRHMEMVGAEKEAVANYKGIWSDVERRKHYLKRHKQMARDKGRKAPRLANPGEVLEDVGEEFTKGEFLIGIIIVVLLMMSKSPIFDLPGKAFVGTFKLPFKVYGKIKSKRQEKNKDLNAESVS